MKQYPQAVADYGKVIRLKPDDAEAFHNRGIAYAKLGDYSHAIADFDRAIVLQPDDGAARHNRDAAKSKLNARSTGALLSNHGIWFLIGLALFPRITLLLFAATPFGWLAWLGWLFGPHLLVAILSIPYWHTHPFLVIAAWVMALVGTSGEAQAVRNRSTPG